MKKLIFSLGLGLLLSACQSDEISSGKGRAVFHVQVNSDITVTSRTNDDLSEKAIVTISNSRGIIRKYEGLENLPKDGLWLNSGHYLASAQTGDSVPASWTQRFFRGAQPFDITPSEVKQIEIPCRIANVAISVRYAENLNFTDIEVVAGLPDNKLTWSDKSTARGYFMLPNNNTPLTYTLKAKDANNQDVNYSGEILSPKSGTEYVLNIKPSTTPSGSAAGITISVDSHMIEVADQMIISLPPEITGTDFDISQPLGGTKGEFKDVMLNVSASSAIKSATLKNASLGEINLLLPNNESLSTNYQLDEVTQNSTLTIDIKNSFLNTLDEGTHTFEIDVTDANNLKSTATLTIIVSSAPVILTEIDNNDVWATHTLVKGQLIKADAKDINFMYKEHASQSWETIKATLDGNNLSAKINALKPSTAYDLKLSCEDYETSELTFTTEAALQLPNAGFEDWQTTSTPYLIYPAGGDMFWDSGNHGSKIMNKNVTVPDTEVKHSGEKSVKMASQFVGIGTIGRFAAGNLFIGKYLKTVGTDGVLGWGRNFTSRPRALKGYIKYRPGTINYVNAACPDPELIKGNPDKGIIYIAILDESTQSYEDQNFPVIVKTKASERQLFDRTASNVIAYGEKIFTGDTAGEGMIEFEIPLEYVSTPRKAVNIMIVAAASKGGDYFTGGTSTMWLDDLELVY